ncbi:glycoside hydrolase family 3 C-terminal domain-containing protein [Actinomyces sp. B33]|uniref:glycoside hydrolase family 3 protein n=1 Tax=Actinomyces sp. B33 TaxID=2942131 RepID=UPI0023422AB7|nr:glycoside hydrolase family 3 N-terminal domain-containing protein [Actinomyces sp. B33]MDC4232916.1 glycoside hydrolase family 3 C-terminal domain-containing protein [Actinomyces sp. B33]
MRISRSTSAVAVVGAAAFALAGCSTGAPQSQSGTAENTGTTYVTTEMTDGKTEFTQVKNPNGGQVLSFATGGAMKVVEAKDGDYTYAFKDINGNGELDPAEDWRLDAKERAAAYVKGLTKEQMSGLMLFSSHERAPGDGLTEDQKTYLSQSYLRNVLNAGPSDVKMNVQWVNEMQAYVETLGSAELPYIPVNYSSDPRSDASQAASFSEAGEISKWPSSLGLAATFDPDTVLEFGKMASQEYKALGIATALSPQIDLATEPRWLRVSGTFGEDAQMAGAMAKSYVDGFQGTFSEGGENTGWGDQSVNAMIKHWPGDGAGEGGRESHTSAGQYEVMVGGNSAEHISVFQQALDAASVMTSYSITLDANGDPEYTDRMGSSYDAGKLSALRDDNGFDGVVCTDWGVTNALSDPDAFIATGWGSDSLTKEERHYAIIKNGTDMFGGNNDAAPVLAAYDMWQADYEAGTNDIDAQTRWAQSAQRVLTMIFNADAFDNPFLDLDASSAAVGSDDKVEAGRQAQLNSIVLLKNDGAITLDENADYSDKTVYVPHTYDTGRASLFSPEPEVTEGISLDEELLSKYFGTVVTDTVVDNGDGTFSYTAPDLTDVDVVLVGMKSPNSGAVFANSGLDAETGTYYPLSLQYRPYTADGPNVRQTSISGDILPDGTKENRSYYGQTSRLTNEADLDALLRAREAVDASGKDIPVIAVLKANNPVIPAEFEAQSDAIVVGFGTAQEALIEIALGKHEANGRLPIQFPQDMDTVEANKEDVAKDVTPYTDSAGNVYDYGFGLHIDGSVITD